MLPGCNRGHVLRLDHPGCARADLSALDVAATDHAQRRHLADTNDLSRAVERDLAALGPFAAAVDCNGVVTAETTHALLRPSVTVASWLAAAIEQPCDLPIRH